jgi:hypothetical protein
LELPDPNDAGAFRLTVNGTAANSTGTWSIFSDARLKHSITPIGSGSLDRLLSLKGYTYQYLHEAVEKRLAEPGTQTGLIAQEVEKVFPEWVGEDEEGYLYITERGLTAIIIEALRELRQEKDAEIARLREENKLKLHQIQQANGDLNARLEKLETHLQSLVQTSTGESKLRVENVSLRP